MSNSEKSKDDNRIKSNEEILPTINRDNKTNDDYETDINV